MINITGNRKVYQRKGNPERPADMGKTAIEEVVREILIEKVRFEQRFEKGARKPPSRCLGEEHPGERGA